MVGKSCTAALLTCCLPFVPALQRATPAARWSSWRTASSTRWGPSPAGTSIGYKGCSHTSTV